MNLDKLIELKSQFKKVGIISNYIEDNNVLQ